ILHSDKDKKHLFEVYHLIFYLMYHKVGNKQEATTFYHKALNWTYTSDFYSYESTPDETLFFNYQIIKNLFYSVFYLPDEDIEFLKKNGYNLGVYEHAMNLYDQFKSFASNTDGKFKVVDCFYCRLI